MGRAQPIYGQTARDQLRIAMVYNGRVRAAFNELPENSNFRLMEDENYFRCLSEDFSKSTASQTVRFQYEDSIMTIYKLCKFERNLWTSMFSDLPNVV